MTGKLATENDVKTKAVKPWFDKTGAWHYAPIQNGMGESGIHDRIACVPIIVTQAMVGKRIGLFISVEAKKPGRRGEANEGLTTHQRDNLNEINAAGGISIRCDCPEDMTEISGRIAELTGMLGLEAAQ